MASIKQTNSSRFVATMHFLSPGLSRAGRAASIHVERFRSVIVGGIVSIVFHFGIIKVRINAEWIVTRAAVFAIIAILIFFRLIRHAGNAGWFRRGCFTQKVIVDDVHLFPLKGRYDGVSIGDDDAAAFQPRSDNSRLCGRCFPTFAPNFVRSVCFQDYEPFLAAPFFFTT